MISDVTGRLTLITKDGYGFVGKPYETDERLKLNQRKYYDVPLRPQRTVIQFNSTYMELIDRWDRTRGEVVSWFGIFFAGFLTLTSTLTYFAIIKASFVIVLILVFCLPFLYMSYKVLRLEFFSYRYFPLRFNRKTGKVHVLQATGKVETFHWKNLRIDMLQGDKEICYVRCCVVDNDGNVKQTFSLPSTHVSTNEFLIQHFEFVNRYMKAKTDDDLAEVASSIRYLFPVHERRERLKETFERAQFDYHFSSENMEYPEQSLQKGWIYYINVPFIVMHFIGRLIGVYTSKQPTFSAEIESESRIDPDDKFDLNKNPPVPELLAPPTLYERVMSFVLFVIGFIVTASIFAFLLDVYATIRPGDYPNFLKGLWDILLLKWL